MRKNKSAIKRTRQSEERRLRNSHVKSTMKTYIKRAVQVIEAKDKEHLDELLKRAVSYIDKAASKGVIHPNNASRKVARLSKRANVLSNKITA
ncbi:MAG TPA: 30S ribosomal protein S20 [Syntrophorhabdaceae bacterium]|nr:30S ribosomal protein S20 [Syntrophorhabdaceae bacterium]MDI9562183.1 30S ribosomal protein S20 [Pseudomonadota bacterium]OQC48114.1 MAG: 30S ribosomal protein S20 [Deltaproteobacteria bacterium ADurb.Bin026]MBP8698717.1 30S ribosomal protein S20 [Syntrophorhabdaceae bacterium]MBV6505719.1 30S ribosomal protein S20 [Syntrophorhabdaceae bacterium]